jgi:pyridoxal phosphate enzyme (YggS family)
LDAFAHLQDNVARVEERISAACHRSGRRREDVKLVAVSKTHSPEAVRAAYAAGLRDFGENRVQEAQGKIAAVADLGATWHLVGHLQTNKVRPACDLFQWVHSVDSIRLAQRLAQAGRPNSEPLPALIEVNLGDEASKSGLPAAQVPELAAQIGALPALSLRGLMVIPPFFANPEEVRPYFRRLRTIAKEIEEKHLPNVSMRELSMGMSHDLETAIEEGATIVRVGTAIFGERK